MNKKQKTQSPAECGTPCLPHHSPDELVTLGTKKRELLAFESNERLTWCNGCGDYGIRNALIRAMALEGLTQQDVVIFYDIGCHGNGADKIGAYTFHGLHGRVIPLAAGAALANPRLKVVAEGGDGGTLSEGIGHLVHAVRSNYKMLFILHNNENYGLTTGQASSTTRVGRRMNGTPEGVFLEPMNVCDFVLGLGGTFVARTFSGDVKHMADMLRAGLAHDGFAFLEVLQTCPSYNRETPQEWYWERIKYLEANDGGGRSKEEARKLAVDLENEINVGVLYRDPQSVSVLNHLASRKGVKTALVEEVSAKNIESFVRKLK